MTEDQPVPTKPYRAWGLFNWGTPWAVERTRREAICEAERITGKPWKEARRYCKVVKVEVSPL